VSALRLDLVKWSALTALKHILLGAVRHSNRQESRYSYIKIESRQ